MSLKAWLLVAGIVVILFFALGSVTSEREKASGVVAGYWIAILSWACVLAFPNWRTGLVDLGVPVGWSWLLAPIGTLVVIAASVIAWRTSYAEETSGWWWIPAWIGYAALLIGYGLVAGPTALA
jgi:hypothetical protein